MKKCIGCQFENDCTADLAQICKEIDEAFNAIDREGVNAIEDALI